VVEDRSGRIDEGGQRHERQKSPQDAEPNERNEQIEGSLEDRIEPARRGMVQGQRNQPAIADVPHRHPPRQLLIEQGHWRDLSAPLTAVKQSTEEIRTQVVGNR